MTMAHVWGGVQEIDTHDGPTANDEMGKCELLLQHERGGGHCLLNYVT